jgi:pilus assembly protein Flp/PilA
MWRRSGDTLNPFATFCGYFPFERGEPMRRIIARFLKDDAGATALEYALIAAIVTLGLITSYTATGTKLSSYFQSISGNF